MHELTRLPAIVIIPNAVLAVTLTLFTIDYPAKGLPLTAAVVVAYAVFLHRLNGLTANSADSESQVIRGVE